MRVLRSHLDPAHVTRHREIARSSESLGRIDHFFATLAKELGVPANRLTEIMRGTRDVSADTAIRLGRYFRTDPRFWLNLQAAYDLSKAEKTHNYKKIVPRTAA